tara:strand:- start:1378 stop:3498 length:2121 start_codon:yes stop_codon:yes gene_type:complete
MKWLGQYIQDLTARFRDDVYLENISSGTIASGGNLGLDSNNKVVKQSDTGITDLHGAGVDGANNQVLTDDGDGTVTSEANLTFDGTTLATTGKATINSGPSAGGPSLSIAQEDVDQHGISIDATALTAAGSADAIFIDAANAVSPIHVDQDIGATNSISHNGAFYSNVAKASVTASGQTCNMHGAQFIATDTGDNVGTVNVTGLKVSSNMTSDTGTTTLYGIHNKQTGTADTIAGYLSELPAAATDIKLLADDGGGDDYFSINIGEAGVCDITTVDGDSHAADLTFNIDGLTSFKNYSNHDTRFSITGNDSDYFGIAVGNNGDTTLSTIDLAGANAHLSITADGRIGQYSTPGTYRWYVSGNDSDYLQLDIGTHGSAKFTTLDSASDAADIELEADGAIILDSAGNIDLEAAGDVTIDSTNLTMSSATSAKPVLTLLTTHTDKDKSAELMFRKNAVDTEDGEDLGIITFYGEDEGNNNTKFAHIKGEIAESDDGAEGGSIKLAVAAHDGEMRNGLIIQDGDAEDEIDVTIGEGTESVTTVAGHLTAAGSVRGKLIHVVSCNFSDAMVTSEHFIPFVTASESTAFANVATPWIAPVAGKLLKVHWRSSQHCNISSNEMSFRLYKISDGTRWSGTNESLLGTKVVTGPARTTHVVADFQTGLESGAGAETNAFAANDILGVSIQHSQDQGSTEKVTVTLVFELDFSSY